MRPSLSVLPAAPALALVAALVAGGALLLGCGSESGARRGVPPDADACREMLISDDARQRAEGATGLAALGARDAAPDVRGLLADPSARVRAAAALALGELDDQESAPALISRLDDPEREVRMCAGAALQRLNSSAGFDALVERFLRPGDLPKAADCFQIAARFRTARIVEPGRAFLASLIARPAETLPLRLVERVAGEVLVHSPPAGDEQVSAALASKDAAECFLALERVVPASPPPVCDQARALLRDERAAVQVAAATACARARVEEAAPDLEALFVSFTLTLFDGDEENGLLWLRAAAFGAWRRLAPPTRVQERLLRDAQAGSPAMRAFAAAMLKERGAPPLTSEEDDIARAAFEALLADDHPDHRMLAAHSLATAWRGKAQPALRARAAVDSDPKVRDEIERAARAAGVPE
ncbi:MAG: HEAT repeat domain-containing protein [Planctomycetes bacterium]|nr:HEAT repeat domain-containing protein [Planctomycetota bacterium]